MKKVDWIKQYKIDNIFNIVILLACLWFITLDLPEVCLIPIAVGLCVNISARGYFNTNKYK